VGDEKRLAVASRLNCCLACSPAQRRGLLGSSRSDIRPLPELGISGHDEEPGLAILNGIRSVVATTAPKA
jgi:hypothetical protein